MGVPLAFYRSLPADMRERELKREGELGVPTDKKEREAHWRKQTEVWRPWMQAVSEHRWLFQPETVCLNCGQVTTTMEAGQSGKPLMTLCVECLNTGIAHYPTGWVMAEGPKYIRHSEHCILHSSYPTSSSSMPSVKLYTPSEIVTSPPSTSKSTSSSKTQSSQTTLFSDTPSRLSASSRPMSLNSNTTKN